MQFQNSDLLTFNQIQELISNDSPNDRSDIIVDKLKYYCFYNKGDLFIYDSSKVIYKKIETTIDEELLTVISKYITNSIKHLTNEQKQLLSYNKDSKRISENSTINKSLSQIKVGLKRNDEEIFTPNFYEIHFNNGYIDLKTLEFKERIQGKDYVNLYIKRNYEPSTENQIDKLYSIIKKIYPKKEDLEAILYILGSAITGRATKLQKLLFLLGMGSSGKSTIMIITQKAMECYLETLEEDAFSESNKNADKTFSTFYNRPSVRIIWINEPKEDKMNKSTFKKFCEGELKGKLLYRNGTHEFKHYGLPVFTSNTMPNINIDSGVKRRFRCYNHTSEFTADKSKVNKANNVYLLDLDVIENIISENLLNTWIDILASYANKWINGNEIPIPKSFQEFTDEVIDANDHIKDFIDEKLIITDGGRNDKISKNDMLDLFQEMFPKRRMTHQILLSALKEKGVAKIKDVNGNEKTVKIAWDKEIRDSSDKGCYINVIRRDVYKVDNTLNETINEKELKKENEELKLRIEELETKLKLLEEVNIEDRKKTIEKLRDEINLLGCDNTKSLLQDYVNQLDDIYNKINFQNAVKKIECDIDEFKFFEEEELKKHTKKETIIEETIIDETIIEKPKIIKKKKSMKKPTKQVQENISIEITKQDNDNSMIIEEEEDNKITVYSLEDIDDIEL